MSLADPHSGAVEQTVGPEQVIAFAALVLAGFFSMADIQIVASSISVLSSALFATIEEVAWVQSAYVTAEIIVIPLSAWIILTFSTRYVVAVGMAGFTIFSLACAFAWNLPSMVVFRVFQGMFGGLLLPTVISSVYIIFPPRLQTIALSIAGMALTMPIIVGPVAGGWITEHLSWHWLFLINIPVGIAVVIAVLFTVRFDKPNLAFLKRVDLPGIVLTAIFLGTGEFVLREGTKYDWFESALILHLTIISLVSFAFFLWRELTAKYPVVDLRLFGNAQFAMGCVLSFVAGFMLFGITYLIPVMLSSVSGFNSLQIGSVMMVTGVFCLFATVFGAAFGQKLGPKAMICIGAPISVLGMLVDSHLTHDIGFNELFLGQALRGFGMTLVGMFTIDMALGRLDPTHVASGSGFVNVIRNMGGAVGLSLITWLMQTRQDLHYERLSESVTQGKMAYDVISTAPALPFQSTVLDPGIAGTIGTEFAYQMAAREALVMMFNDLWLLLALLLTATFLFLPFLKNPLHGGVSPAAH